jgi:hypothetical protein
MNEKAFADEVLTVLKPHFDIQEQVKGKHFSGKCMRIDAILTPLNKTDWKNPNITLGVEFKNDFRLRGDTNNYTKWLAQCVDYCHTIWGDYGYIYVFTCPSLVEGLPSIGDTNAVQWIVPRIMAPLGIGELKKHEQYGWTFFLQEAHRIWSEKEGVKEGKHWDLKRKFGSR